MSTVPGGVTSLSSKLTSYSYSYTDIDAQLLVDSATNDNASDISTTIADLYLTSKFPELIIGGKEYLNNNLAGENTHTEKELYQGLKFLMIYYN